MLPLRAPVHAMSSYGLEHFCSDHTDVNQLRWVPGEGEAVSELVSLWLQPGSEKPFVLSLALLAPLFGEVAKYRTLTEKDEQ